MSQQDPKPKSEIIRNRRILVVDDHRNIRISLKMTLEGEGALVTEAESLAAALGKVGSLEEGMSPKYDCVLLDIRLPDGSGLDLLKRFSQAKLASRVIMISGEGTISDAFKATQMGAFDYIEKPFGEERIIVCVARCLDFNRLANDKEKLEERIKSQEILGNHPAIQEVLRLVAKVAPTNGRVLITGESGTGKELVARAIHRQSGRSDKPLIKVNCAAIPANLIESELFGHEKGSFTGAVKQRKGVFERADGGTLFLDEIGELSLEVQAKLLRALQNGEIQRVGGEKLITVDVRLLAATNRDLAEMVQHGEYREDLYYRLNVLTLHLPPLRQRMTDIIALAEVFLKEACQEHALGEKYFGPVAKKQLESYSWPGNIRELRNIVERTAILSEEALIEAIEGMTVVTLGGRSQNSSSASDKQEAGSSRQSHLQSGQEGSPLSASSGLATTQQKGGGPSTPGASETLIDQGFSFSSPLTSWQDFHESAGRSYLKYVLKATQGNVSEAARLLCLERAYLHRLMKKLGIQREIIVSD